MLKHGQEFFDWIRAGAYIYVCGAREPMSVDVENALLAIIAKHANKKTNEAIAYLDELKAAGRYLEDVY
jgi:sulfite reductase (NADPH) flavoprotein alpha-component